MKDNKNNIKNTKDLTKSKSISGKVKNIVVKKVASKFKIIDDTTTILVKPDLLIEFAYKYGTNNVASTLMSAIEGTILANSSLKHDFLSGVVITNTLQQKYARNMKKVNKFINEATLDQTGYKKGTEKSKGYAKGRVMNTDLLRFAGKKTYAIQYQIVYFINELKKEGYSLDEVKNIIIPSKLFKKYIKKYNNFDPSRIVQDVNKTASENKSLKKSSIKISSTKNLEKFIIEKTNFNNKLRKELSNSKDELNQNISSLDGIVYIETSIEVQNLYDELLEKYLEDLKNPEVKSNKRKPDYSLLIKRKNLVLNNIKKSSIPEVAVLFNKINYLFTKIKDLKNEIQKNEFLIKTAKSYIVDFERYGKVYYTNHLSELTGRDYNTIANIKKELRNILLEDYVEIDINNTAYRMFQIIARSNNIKVDTLDEYVKNRHRAIEIFGSELKIDFLRLFNSDVTNKNRIKNKYPIQFHSFIDNLYNDLMKIKEFILKNKTFIFLDTIFTIQGNEKNILSIMYMKMESIIINKLISFGNQFSGFEYVRIHDAIFFNKKEYKLDFQNYLDKLLNSKIEVLV